MTSDRPPYPQRSFRLATGAQGGIPPTHRPARRCRAPLARARTLGGGLHPPFSDAHRWVTVAPSLTRATAPHALRRTRSCAVLQMIVAFRLSIAVLAVLVPACTHLPGHAHTLPAPLPSPGLRLDLFIPRTGPIQARLRVPKERLPETPETSPIEFVHPEDVARTKGQPTTVTVSSAKDLELTWEVQPTPLDELTDPAVRRTAVPFDTGGARYLPLVALVPFASQLRISAMVPVSLHVRSDEHAAAPRE
jgi:hypothetical protein